MLKVFHHSIANRVTGLVRRVGDVPDVVMTGGVAQNTALLKLWKVSWAIKFRLRHCHSILVLLLLFTHAYQMVVEKQENG